ncbi:hypothetical protein, partial [Pontibacter rugosus]
LHLYPKPNLGFFIASTRYRKQMAGYNTCHSATASHTFRHLLKAKLCTDGKVIEVIFDRN